VSAMEAPEQNDDWRQTFPLLDNIIAGKDSPARRQFVALMRTFGENVRRSGAGYKRIPGGAVPKCPIRIELAAQRGAYKLGTPIRITVKEIGQVNGAWICFNGEIEESLEGPIGIMYTGGGGSEDFANTRAPKRDFTKLKKGSVHTFTDDPSFSIERAGVYKVSLKKTYTHDGASVGLDAWTGVAFSEPVQITVIK